MGLSGRMAEGAKSKVERVGLDGRVWRSGLVAMVYGRKCAVYMAGCGVNLSRVPGKFVSKCEIRLFVETSCRMYDPLRR